MNPGFYALISVILIFALLWLGNHAFNTHFRRLYYSGYKAMVLRTMYKLGAYTGSTQQGASWVTADNVSDSCRGDAHFTKNLEFVLDLMREDGLVKENEHWGQEIYWLTERGLEEAREPCSDA